MTARARARRDATHAHRAAPHVVREVLRTPGEELEPKARDWMEPRFGHDFRHVRVHRDDRAAAAAESIGAEAFTAGRHVVFGAGRYTPAVLAHELSHVTPHEHDADALRVGSAHDPEETRAEANVTRIASFAGGGATAPLPNAGGDGAPVIRRLSRGATIGLAALGGGAAGALIGGLGFGGIGALVGGVIGAALGAGIAALATSQAAQSAAAAARRPRGPVGRHLEVALDVNFTPTGTTPATIRQLPRDTRVIREPAPANSPPAPANGVHVRVTTGPLRGATGWVDEGALVERTNTEVLTPEDAQRLWTELSQSSFLTTSGTEAPIPFHYPVDGCFARARRMDDILREAGYETEKVFVVSRRNEAPFGRLRVPTQYGDTESGQSEPGVRWWYHVAPEVEVLEANGRVGRYVLDPSITTGPVTIRDWIALQTQNPDDFREVTIEDFRAEVEEAGGVGSYEGDVFFRAPRGTYEPMRDEPRTPDAPTRTLTDYAARARVRELLAALRRQLAGPSATIEQIVAVIQAAPADARRNFASDPEGARMLTMLQTRFGAEYQQIEAALQAP